jgi:hypothetical protein
MGRAGVRGGRAGGVEVSARLIVRLISIAALLALAPGCATVNLRDAQDAFNQAAADETRLRQALDPATFLSQVTPDGAKVDGRLNGRISADPVTELARVQAGYAAAVNIISRLEADIRERGRLRQDKLLGVALTLKALAQWRLALYPEAAATAERAEKEAGDQIFPRDRALLKALPGLVRNDEAFRKIYRGWPENQRAAVFTEVLELLGNSHKILGEARQLVTTDDPRHPVLIYLIQAQLATYQNRRDAYAHLGSTDKLTPEADRKSAQVDYCALEALLKDLKVDESQRDAALTRWDGLNLKQSRPSGLPAVPCPQ